MMAAAVEHFAGSSSVPKFGTTPPVSYSHPTNADVEVSNELYQYLADRNVFESSVGQSARDASTKALHSMIVRWVRSIGLRKGIYPAALENGCGVQLRVYGSQRLGVHSPTADIGR